MKWLEEKISESRDRQKFLDDIREVINRFSPMRHNPVDHVKWVDYRKVQANDYNPNQVAKNEMKLLHTSIKHDGYTQPIVTVYDEKKDKYIVVDGFHRYSIMRYYEDIRKKNRGLLPIVVIDKDINDRMASTIRHNRARGKHSVQGMSNIVFNMLDNGWTDAEIIKELGMEHEELIRLKHITGFSKLFENAKYSRAWETKNQLKRKREWQEEEGKIHEEFNS